jgi:hypothetical protein
MCAARLAEIWMSRSNDENEDILDQNHLRLTRFLIAGRGEKLPGYRKKIRKT